jgi:hypothetical protein
MGTHIGAYPNGVPAARVLQSTHSIDKLGPPTNSFMRWKRHIRNGLHNHFVVAKTHGS